MALGIAAALFVWFAIDLLLLLFAGLLFGIFLGSLASQVSARTRLGYGAALGLVCVVLVGLSTGAGILFTGQLSEQARGLSERVPAALQTVVERLNEWEWSRWLVEQARGSGPQVLDGDAVGQGEVVAQATDVAWRLVDGLVALVIVVFVGIYLAAAPGLYVRGLLRLVPIRRRERVGEVIYAIGYTLRWWLFGQLLAMVAVGVTMGVGLALIGVPLAAGLGVMAGLFEFIPTVGPILAVVPALLLALVDSPDKAFWVVALYAVIQTVESYLLTPLLQQRVVHLPPVLTIATQVLLAWRLGPLGLVVAVPLIAVVLVAVQMIYVKDVLTDRFESTAEREGRRELEASGHLQSLL
jgi:predicted PurR-regulated permease PerM